MIMAETAERKDSELPVSTEEMELVGRARRGDLEAYDALVKRQQ